MRRQAAFVTHAALLLALGLVCTQGWSATDEDTASVSLTINEGFEVSVADVTTFGQDHTSEGLPGPGDGEDPLFTGGADTDQWLDGFVKGYAHGAVGRSQITVQTNAECTMMLVPQDVVLTLSGGAAVLPATCQVGRLKNGLWKLNQGYTDIPWNGTGVNTDYWLYALVKRQGLSDPNGTYSATVTIQAGTP